MKYLIVSCSLNPGSRSRILAVEARAAMEKQGVEVEFLDLAEAGLPVCDGGSVFGDPAVQKAAAMVQAADGILLATPIYNFDVNAAAKNLIELTGRDGWADKVAGFLCAAGGQGSYMAVMAVANSLMLDFRTTIVPRFVYATGEAFGDGGIADAEVAKRVAGLSAELIRYTTALRG